jgi:GT2 family glycosyltransferase
MRCAFVILCSDEAPLLERSLAVAVAEGFDEGLVIDNASRDATAAVAERYGVRRLALDSRVPYTRAMNAGLRAIGGDAIAFLQADTFIEHGYLQTCRAELKEARIGSVAPKLVRTLGSEESDRLTALDAAAMTFDRRRKNSLVGHGAPAGAFAGAAEAFGADGAAALWRREALEDCAIEGAYFDENMPGWGCDADLAWRAQLFGWGSRYEPAAVVHHIRTYSPTTRASATDADRRTQFRNRLLMIAKNDSWRDLVRDATPLVAYEVAALGYALVRERELLGGYVEAWRRLPEARRQHRLIQARRRVKRVPFGLVPPGVPAGEEGEAHVIARASTC